MKLLLTAAAVADLEDISDYISLENPVRAKSFIEELRAACDGILEIPRGYPLVPRHEQFGIRRKVHGNYLIFYRISGETIEVIHVLHGARDYESLLFPKN